MPVQSLKFVDYHVGGEPLRIIDQVMVLPGTTMAERLEDARRSMTDLKNAIVNEPRGHAEMFGALRTAPVEPDSDFGVIYFDASDFKAACGHGAMAIATAAVEMGWVESADGEVQVKLDIAAGRVTLSLSIERGRVRNVTYRHIPSYLLAEGVDIKTSQGNIRADVCYAGATVALIEASQLGFDPIPGEIPKLRALYREITQDRNAFQGVPNPDTGRPIQAEPVLFYRDLAETDEGISYDVAAFFGDGSLDRSPCGVGTSARLAQLYAQGKITEADRVTATSVVGSSFMARVTDPAEGAGKPMIVPQITGRAFRSASGELYFSDDDPLAAGFRVS